MKLSQKDRMPGHARFSIGCDLWFVLHPEDNRFSGSSRVAYKIYPHLEAAYQLGLIHGVMGDENDRKRIIRGIDRQVIPKSLPRAERPFGAASKQKGS